MLLLIKNSLISSRLDAFIEFMYNVRLILDNIKCDYFNTL